MSDQRLIGHYRIVELLGSGAMGKVHSAVDTFIDREVAIKSLRAELTQDPEFVGRFRAEASSLARLNHPNITTLYAPLLDGDELYMVMELVRGRPLDEILRDRNGPLGVKESLAIIAQAADGLSYAHQMGVIHRDIKPSNLMIADNGRVKIMDFGIARVRGSVRMTRAGTAIGTPLYMAPEQRRGSEGDERSDLYSLAIVLYEILSGAPPFAGLDEVELLQAQIHSEPPPLVPHAAGVTPELEAAIMTALAKRPEQRFQTVRAFSDAIGATVMRLDATGVVKSPAHLIEARQTGDEPGSAPKLPAVALAVAKSRSTSLMRRFKALHPAAQGVSVAVAAFVLLSPVLLGFDAPPSATKRKVEWSEADQISKLDQGTGRSASMDEQSYQKSVVRQTSREDADARARLQKSDAVERLAQREECSGLFGVDDCQPTAVPAYKQSQSTRPPEKVALNTSASLAEIRKAMKEKDFDRAHLLVEPLAEAGDREAQYQLGMISLKAPGRQKFADAFKWMKKSAEQAFPEAQAVLGNMYQNGDADGRENLEEAVRWYSKAAEQSNARGQFWLGKCYEIGIGNVLKKDYKKAGDLYRKASLQDFPGAAQALENLRKAGRY